MANWREEQHQGVHRRLPATAEKQLLCPVWDPRKESREAVRRPRGDLVPQGQGVELQGTPSLTAASHCLVAASVP